MTYPSITTDPDAEAPAPEPVIRYANLAGAEVHVTQAPARRPDGYLWACTGCLDGFAHPTDLDRARTRAAGHAASCRALPRL